jgi:hypothetical protein
MIHSRSQRIRARGAAPSTNQSKTRVYQARVRSYLKVRAHSGNFASLSRTLPGLSASLVRKCAIKWDFDPSQVPHVVGRRTSLSAAEDRHTSKFYGHDLARELQLELIGVNTDRAAAQLGVSPSWGQGRYLPCWGTATLDKGKEMAHARSSTAGACHRGNETHLRSSADGTDAV